MTTTPHTTQHVTIPVQVNRSELLCNIMGSAWETWSWWRTCEYTRAHDWDTHPELDNEVYVVVSISDPDDENEYRTRKAYLTVGDLIRATATILTKYPHVRWDDMDACDGDLIMQTAVLGDVVYA